MNRKRSMSSKRSLKNFLTDSHYSKKVEIDEFLELESKVSDKISAFNANNSSFAIALKRIPLSPAKIKKSGKKKKSVQKRNKNPHFSKYDTSENRRKILKKNAKKKLDRRKMARKKRGKTSKSSINRSLFHEKEKSSKKRKTPKKKEIKPKVKFTKKRPRIENKLKNMAKSNKKVKKGMSYFTSKSRRTSDFSVGHLKAEFGYSSLIDNSDSGKKNKRNETFVYQSVNNPNYDNLFGTTEKTKNERYSEVEIDEFMIDVDRLNKFYDDQITNINLEFFQIEEMMKRQKQRLIEELEQDFEKNLEYVNNLSKERSSFDLDCLVFKPEKQNIKRFQNRLGTLFLKSYKEVKIKAKNWTREGSLYLRNLESPKSNFKPRRLTKNLSRSNISGKSINHSRNKRQIDNDEREPVFLLSKKSSNSSIQMKKMNQSLTSKIKREQYFTGSNLQKKLHELKNQHRGESIHGDPEDEEEIYSQPPVMINLEQQKTMDKFILNHLSLANKRAVFKPVSRAYSPLFNQHDDDSPG